MRMNAFHDMVAAITAYLSLLEHDLVLALAFCGFDPDKDNLTEMIRHAKWGDKFRRVLGNIEGAERIRRRLFDVVERWRNPYSHGGFEKGQTATIYLHTPGVGAAVPIGLTDLRDSPLFSFLPATETDIAEVFALFDEIDAWLESTLPEAMQWINSALAVRFDEVFRMQLEEVALDTFAGDTDCDPLITDPRSEFGVVVGFVGMQFAGFPPPGSASGPDRGNGHDQWLERGGVVGVGRGDRDRQRQATAVGQDVDLRAGFPAVHRAGTG